MVGYGDLVRPFTSMQIIVVSLPTLGQDRKVLCGMWLLASSVRLEQHLPISGRSGWELKEAVAFGLRERFEPKKERYGGERGTWCKIIGGDEPVMPMRATR